MKTTANVVPRSRSSPRERNGTGKVEGQEPNPTRAERDRALVDRCLVGEEKAWEELYRDFQPGLVRSIQHHLGEQGQDADLVDEIAARVWYALLKNEARLLASYDPQRNSRFRSFLSGLARIEVLRHARRRQVQRSHEWIAGRDALDKDRVPDWTMRTMMDEFSATLTAGERDFLNRHLILSEQVQMLAAPEKLPPSTIWKRRERIKRKLENYIAGQ